MVSAGSKLRRQIGYVMSAVESWLLTRDGNGRGLELSSIDRVRLLQLYAWSLKYRLPIEEILDILLPILRAQIAKPRKRIMIGIRVPALVGKGAEEILEREITKRYPGNEHVALWKEAGRQRQLRRERREEGVEEVAKYVSLMDYSTIEAFCEAYHEKIENQRRETEIAMSRRGKRNYRWNPWR